MIKRRKHKDVEYHVERPDGETDIYEYAGDAAGHAIALAMGGKPATIDVVVWSQAGARHYLGDEGVDQYREDPEASVFDHIVVKAESLGRIP